MKQVISSALRVPPVLLTLCSWNPVTPGSVETNSRQTPTGQSAGQPGSGWWVMRALIVESSRELGTLWRKHLERQGVETRLALGESDAVAHLQDTTFEILVIDLVLDQGSPLAIADFAHYRQPAARVIFVTNTSFFSDGSIFQHCPNACAFLQTDAPPEDLVAMVDHYGTASR